MKMEKVHRMRLLDFSALGESTLYMDGVHVPPIHKEDGKYLREMAHHHYTVPKPEQNRAETTDFPLSKELKRCSFKVYLHYRGTTLLFTKCQQSTTIREIITRGLLQWEPMDLSCSWLKSDAQDYVLQLTTKKEYVCDATLPLYALVYVRNSISRGQKVEFTLLEKSALDSILLSQSSSETKELPIPFTCKTKEEIYIPSYQLKDPLVMCMHKIDVIPEQWMKEFTCYTSHEDIMFSIEIGIYHNAEELCEMIPYLYLKYEDIGKEVNREIGFPLSICELPRESYFRIRIGAKRENMGMTQKFVQTWIFMETVLPVPIGWGDCSIYDFQGCLRTHSIRVPLHNGSVGSNMSMYLPFLNENEGHCCVTVSLKNAPLSMSSTNVCFIDIPIHPHSSSRRLKIRERDWEKIRSGKASDTLFWKYRHHIRKKAPERLIPLLKSVNWSDKLHISEIHDLLNDYPMIYPFAGFEILALPISDIRVRAYAVRCLYSLSDKEIQSMIPQLIQSLKKDMYLSSSLSIFLLSRAFSNPNIGNTFYWYLSSEMDDPLFERRFRSMKQCYLESIGHTNRKGLFEVQNIFSKLIYIADQAQNHLTKDQLHSYLYEIPFLKHFYLPTSSKIEIKRIVVEECVVLHSKTKPLWLTFERMDGNYVYLILKIGDDIRVDVLALQMMNVLDSFWKKEGLDLHLQPYIALPMGKRVGLIQVASKSETTSTINWKHGGRGFASAFSKTSLKAYLYKNNTVEERERTFQNFALSCAGYCVFTYVFGVGDRHGDNILCTKQGNLFHIDFGYFLGERSKFFGISRETSCFVLTPNYINAMDTFFDSFVEMSCQGFVIARRYESTFSTLIALMLPCGEEVVTKDQVKYVKGTLEPWISEKEGKRKFYEIIRQSLQDKRTLLNDFAHLLATRSAK